MAVGSTYKGSNVAHNKAELYFHSKSSWIARASYPFHETMRAFEIVPYSDSFILFGGLYDDEQSSTGYTQTDIITKFNPDSDGWTKIGYLQHRRHAFSVIEIYKKFLVIGGGDHENYTKHTETCELNNETIECTTREPTLNNFRYYPAMMIVNTDYADNC